MEYIRYVTPETKPFDPLQLARDTENVVLRGGARKYTAFYSTGVYGGISTGYTVGCCLRCVYCWVDDSRDFPDRRGRFTSSEEVASRLVYEAKLKGLKKARISGGEPTLCRDHLLGVLELIDDSDIDLFILETNGILLGSDQEYAEALSGFKKVHVRLSLKAASPSGFERKTGAMGRYWILPFQGIVALLDAGCSFHVAAMTDSRFMPEWERDRLISLLKAIQSSLARHLEEETVDPYPTTIKRLRYAGFLQK